MPRVRMPTEERERVRKALAMRLLEARVVKANRKLKAAMLQMSLKRAHATAERLSATPEKRHPHPRFRAR